MVAARIGQRFGTSHVGSIGDAHEIRRERPAIERQAPLQGGTFVRKKRPGFFSSLLGLGRGGRNLASLGAITATAIGFSLAAAPNAHADYLRAGPNNTYEIVRSDTTAPLISARLAGENPDQIRALEAPGGLSEQELLAFPLFRKFWNELTNVGEFEIAPSHIAEILQYASTHGLDGTALPQIDVPGRPDGTVAVTEGHRALIGHLLRHPYYGGFFEQEARPLLEAAFGLPIERVEERSVNRPVDQGDIDLSSLPPWQGTNYQGNLVATLHQDLISEFRLNQSWYEGGTKEQSAERLTAMLLHFGRAIHMHGQVESTAIAMDRVSDAFHSLPIFQGDGERARFLREYFARDLNGMGMGPAESIIRGFDPNRVRTSFPDANNRAESTTSLSMSATGYLDALKAIDEYRSAIGLSPGAVDRFRLSVFNGVIGGVQGNNKTTLDERRPFASLVNFGIVLEFGENGRFARDPQAAQLPPKPGFEFPIDAVTATGLAVNGTGATLRVYQRLPNGRAGERVSVEKVIHNDDAGRPQYWSAIFKDSAGNEVPPDQVIGLLERNGRPLGDGLANQTLESGFWGYCDLNTGQTIIGAMHQIPALDVAGPVYITAGDRVIAVPKEIAQQIVNFGVANSVPRTTWAGYRHDRDPQEVRWTRGNSIITDWGRLQGFELDPRNQPRSAIQWGENDQLQLNFGPGRARTLGSIRIDTGHGVSTIDASNIDRIVRADGDEVTIVSNNGSWTTTGKLVTPLQLDWSRAETITANDGTQQLAIRNDPNNPFVGELVLKTVRGTEEIIRADQLQYVKGESEHEIRFSYFVRYVMESNGIYATDASTGPSVSNGARYVNNIELAVERGAGRPEWAKGAQLRGVYGPLVRQPGDHIVFAAGTYGDHNTATWKGWYQVNARGQIINEGWISGMPDTAWGAAGDLDWRATSSFVSELPWEMRVKLFVNGREELRNDTPEGDALARRLNLPSNWREYITPADRIPSSAPIATNGNDR